MITPFAALWREMRALLQARGDLPLDYEVLTPAEIADAVRTGSGDARPHRFVWGYLYPRHYGGAPGAVSDDDATALVGSLQAAPEPPRPAAGAAADECSICHRHPVRRDV